MHPAPLPDGFHGASDDPARYRIRPRLLVEKRLRNMTMRAGWHIDFIDAARHLHIELVAVAPDHLELLLDTYETVAYNARANPGQIVESLAEELAGIGS
jgi:septum formation inhibitor-activating ATPase MinD